MEQLVELHCFRQLINFGRERHGFLAFNDIQSDYYHKIPLEDKEKIKVAEEKIRENLKEQEFRKTNQEIGRQFESESLKELNNGNSKDNENGVIKNEETGKKDLRDEVKTFWYKKV